MGSRKSATTKSGWRQWKPEQAREALEKWRASGLPLGTYARSQGVTPQRLTWWRERLGEWVEPPSEAGEARLVPVNVTSLRPTPMPLAAPSVTVTVRLPGDVTLEVSDVGAVPPEWWRAALMKPTDERPLSICISGEQLALLKKLDYPCSEAILASATLIEDEGFELTGTATPSSASPASSPETPTIPVPADAAISSTTSPRRSRALWQRAPTELARSEAPPECAAVPWRLKGRRSQRPRIVDLAVFRQTVRPHVLQ